MFTLASWPEMISSLFGANQNNMLIKSLNLLWAESYNGWYTKARNIVKSPQYHHLNLSLFGNFKSMQMDLPQRFDLSCLRYSVSILPELRILGKY